MLHELRFFAFDYVKENVQFQTLFVENVMILIGYDSKETEKKNKIKLIGKTLFEFELL